MQSKIFALAVVAIVPMAVSAQNKTYTVRQGDTISEIAGHFKVRRAELIAANALSNSNMVQPGTVLRIPARRPDATPLAAAKGTAYYTVRNGDFDWSLARKHSISVSQLKTLNPGVDFSKLQIGTRIAVPSEANNAPTKVAAKTSKPSIVVAAMRSHKVGSGENDWIIARHAGVSLHALHQANPGLNMDRLQIGQSVKVPVGSIDKASATVAKAAPSLPRIRSSYAIVVGDGSTIRREAGVNGGKVASVDSGTRAKVLDRDGDWYKLKFPKGTVGWMRGDLLKATSTVDIVKERRSGTRVAKREPAPKKSIFKSSPRSGRVARNVESFSGAPVSNSAVVNAALSMRGKHYVWGSTTPSRGGFDCSGLVTYAYKKVGVSLPRTSREMSGHGQKVSMSNLKPGDLVFFHTGRSTRVNHVAMYIGNGKIVHSSSGQGGVRIDSITTGYYARKAVSARRVIKSPASSVAQKPSAPKPETVDGE